MGGGGGGEGGLQNWKGSRWTCQVLTLPKGMQKSFSLAEEWSFEVVFTRDTDIFVMM